MSQSCSIVSATPVRFKFDTQMKTALTIKNDPTNIPAIFSGTLTLASEVHRYNTRFATNFNIYRPSISNNYGATTFSFVASKIWESIPSEFKKNFLIAVSICNVKGIF